MKSADPSGEASPMAMPRSQSQRVPGDRTKAETVEAPPVLPEPDNVYEIDLPTTIRLVLTANPKVAGSREGRPRDVGSAAEGCGPCCCRA